MNQSREPRAARRQSRDKALFGCRIADRTNVPVRFSGREFRWVSQDFERYVEAVEGRGIGVQESADAPFRLRRRNIPRPT
jgi:hypothetical protein